MNKWIFQGNPTRFNVDAYLLDNDVITWSMRQQHLANYIEIGDDVFIWRSDGNEKGSSGIVARAQVISLPQDYINSEESAQYWYEDVTEVYLAVRLKVLEVEVENMLKRTNLLQHEILQHLPILKIRQNTNYLLTADLGAALVKEWEEAVEKSETQAHLQVKESNTGIVLSIPASSTIHLIECYHIHAFPSPRSYNYSNLVTFRKKGGAMRELYTVIGTFVMDVRHGVVNETIERFPTDVQVRIRQYVEERARDFGFEKPEFQFWVLCFEQSLQHEPQAVKTYNGHVYFTYKDLISGEPYVKISSNQTTNTKADYIHDFEQEMNELKVTPIEETEKEQIVKSRIGQSSFKKALLSFEKKCKLCGVSEEAFLIASHIKPWSISNHHERLDVDNGLLLCPNHNQLFDKGFISFLNNGQIVVSDSIDDNTRQFMHIQVTMKIKLTDRQKVYMQWHLENIFR
ncbi:hypothetical protein C3943_11080 [Lysinibacillus sp. B2A1]|nr:hypothetical protein C3943_11080 [Lysinibacillus sp. B2A1]